MSKKGRLSLLFGVVAGTVTGLLFAPTKGKELREKIAKERESGGVGHKSVAKELGKMGDDIGKMAKEVAQSEEAKHFWQETKSAVSDWTEGHVELDEWVKATHEKADQLKKMVSKYAKEKKKYISEVKGVKKKVKKTAKNLKKRAKAVKKAATKKVAPKRKTTTKRKPTPKKKTSPKKKTPNKKK